jgi:poly(hydroxyalkanoate) depolymerase family esterase
MLRSTLIAGVAAVALAPVWPADVSTAATIIERTLPASNQPGSRARQYTVALPDGLETGAPVPVVMVLHGCLQTQRDMIDDTRFVELADREGFVAVFPFVTSFDPMEQRTPNCWGFWFDQHQHEARGEPGDLRRILAEVEAEFPIDAERRYVVGLSSGAAMAVIMGVVYSEDFAAAGSVAGLPYDESDCAVAGICFPEGLRHKSVTDLVAAMTAEQSSVEEQRLVPMMALHSTNDRTVPFKNGQNIGDVWIARYDASTEVEESDCTREGVACQHSIFRTALAGPWPRPSSTTVRPS